MCRDGWQLVFGEEDTPVRFSGSGLFSDHEIFQALLEPMQVEAMAGCEKDKTCTTSRSGRAVQVITSLGGQFRLVFSDRRDRDRQRLRIGDRQR